MKAPYPLLITFVAAAFSANATVLNFDITGATDSSSLSQAYGDRVTGISDGSFSYGSAGNFTPNIVVDYVGRSAANDLSFWTKGYSDLNNVIYYELDGALGFTIKLSADPGFLVRLDGFDFGNFGGQLLVPSLQVQDGQGNVLFSRTNFTLEASSASHQDYDFVSGLLASEMNIILDTTGLGGNSDNIAFDNIQFGQTIPEPSSLVLGAIGILGFSLLRVRDKRNG